MTYNPTFEYVSPCDVCGKPATWTARTGMDDCHCPHPAEEYR